jgi:hypothetical protein
MLWGTGPSKYWLKSSMKTGPERQLRDLPSYKVRSGHVACSSSESGLLAMQVRCCRGDPPTPVWPPRVTCTSSEFSLPVRPGLVLSCGGCPCDFASLQMQVSMCGHTLYGRACSPVKRSLRKL